MRGITLIRSILLIATTAILVTAASTAVFKDNLEVDENSFTAGYVDISANPLQTAVSMDNMKPGDSKTGTLSMINAGSLDLSYNMAAKKDAGISDFYDVLQAKVEQGSDILYEGPVKDLLALSTGRRTLAIGASEDLTITISLPLEVDSSLAKKYTKIAFVFDAEQL